MQCVLGVDHPSWSKTCNCLPITHLGAWPHPSPGRVPWYPGQPPARYPPQPRSRGQQKLGGRQDSGILSAFQVGSQQLIMGPRGSSCIITEMPKALLTMHRLGGPAHRQGQNLQTPRDSLLLECPGLYSLQTPEVQNGNRI